MKELIRQCIEARLADNDCIFVFPSDLAAASWLQTSLRSRQLEAVASSRFISWDNFKDRVFPGCSDRRPSSRLVRMFFSRNLLESNRKTVFLRHIVPAGQSAASLNFVRYLAQALPALGRLGSNLTFEPSPLLEEWLDIRKKYAAFLDQAGLYEPSWLERQAVAPQQHYQLFFPDLTDDWPEYKDSLATLPKVVCHCYETWRQSSEARSKPSVAATQFGNYLQEVRSVLLSIRQAARQGINPASMLISLTDMEACLPVLEREAKIAGIPLDIREARPLAVSAGGRLLKDLLAVDETDASFAAMRRLLLDCSRPYRSPQPIHELMQLALEKHILASIPDIRGDTWLASIPPGQEALAGLYTDIRRHCRNLAGAATFSAVRQHFDAFRQQFLDETAWTAGQNDEIARCILVLDELQTTASDLRLPAINGSAALWYQQLEESLYLATSKTSGVPVYKFRVSAGCQPSLHFVLNLGEQASRLAGRSLRFLREDERAKFETEDTNLSEGIIRILSESGERVYLSHSIEGPDGFRPPHPALTLQPPEPHAQTTNRLTWQADLWLPARDGFYQPDSTARSAQAVGQPTELFPLQKSSLASALVTCAQQAAVDYTLGKPDRPERLPDILKARLLTRLETSGRLTVNVSLMETYRVCAFRYLLEKSYRLAATQTGLSFLDRPLIGNLYHDTLRAIFQPLVEGRLTIVRPEAAGEAERPADSDVPAALDHTIGKLAESHGPFAALMAEAVRPVLIQNLRQTLNTLRTMLDGCIPWQNDQQTLLLHFSDETVNLDGRPDLVCYSPLGKRDRPTGIPAVRLIDYKTKGIPDAKELRGDSAGQPGKLQIPAYISLLEALQVEVEEAWYLGIEKDGKKKNLLKAYGPDETSVFRFEDKAGLTEAIRQACATTANMLRAGQIFVPAYKDLAEACQYCRLPGVCRQHFTVG